MTRISCSMEHGGAVEVYNVDNEDQSIFVQTDWDFPAMASLFGWSPCHNSTDGTVDCPECGKTASEMISEAYDYLSEHEGDIIESVCFDDYFC